MMRRRCFHGAYGAARAFCRARPLPGADFCADHLDDCARAGRDCVVACCVPFRGQIQDGLCAVHREELAAWREIHRFGTVEGWLASRENTQLARLADLEERGL